MLCAAQLLVINLIGIPVSLADDVLTKDAGECVICLEELLQGGTYYFTFIHTKAALAPLWEELRDLPWLNLTFQQELYRQEYWLEITSEKATKAQAALRLKKELGCSRLVAFGDAMNDLPLFAAADESYAVANALPEVKAAATAVIGSNEENGVARFLLQRMGEMNV